MRRVEEINLDIHLTATERLILWREAVGQGQDTDRQEQMRRITAQLNGDSRSTGLYGEKRECLAWSERMKK